MSITSLLIVKHAPNFENFYLTIGDILPIPLILTHAQTKSNYTLKKFWPSKFANDPQIFKQGVVNDPQKFWSCRNTGRLYQKLLVLIWGKLVSLYWIKDRPAHVILCKTQQVWIDSWPLQKGSIEYVFFLLFISILKCIQIDCGFLRFPRPGSGVLLLMVLTFQSKSSHDPRQIQTLKDYYRFTVFPRANMNLGSPQTVQSNQTDWFSWKQRYITSRSGSSRRFTHWVAQW